MGWKDWSYRKKGFVIGLIIGIFFAVIAFIGSSHFLGIGCRWNPAEGSVVPEGICKNAVIISIFYLPYLVFNFAALILYSLVEDSIGEVFFLYYIFNLFSSIVYAFVFAGIGAFIGWITGKLKK